MVQSFRKRGPLGWNVGAGWRKGPFSGVKAELRERQGTKGWWQPRSAPTPGTACFWSPEQGRWSRAEGPRTAAGVASRGAREGGRRAEVNTPAPLASHRPDLSGSPRTAVVA